MNTNTSKLLSGILNTTSPVTIVVNDSDPANPVLVTPMLNADGSPKTDLNNYELGSLRLEQHQRTLNGSFMNARRRVAFLGGTIEELTNLVAQNNIAAGTEIAGKIAIFESLNPMYKNQKPKINPQNNEPVGVAIGKEFYPVYMQMLYVEDANTPDQLIRTPEAVNAWLTNQKMLQSYVTNAPTVETAKVPTVTEETVQA